MGMAPTFMTRYISDSDCAISPSGRRGRTFKHGTSLFSKVLFIFLDDEMESLFWRLGTESSLQHVCFK
jgi:hypothetical protein